MSQEKEDYKLYYEFQYNAVKEATLLLHKGMAFYLAVTAVIVGYVLTQNLEPDLKSKAAVVGVIVSFIALVGGLAMCWGILRGIQSIRLLLMKYNLELYEDLQIAKFFRRGIVSAIIVICCISGILGMFCISLYVLR